MAGDAVLKRMTVAAFLDWDDGSDTRYELYRGEIVAMAPPTGAHGTLQMALGAHLYNALRDRPPCRPISEAGVAAHLDATDFFVADIAVTCAPDRRGARLTEAPLLIVEILSESTEAKVRKLKLPAYRRIASVSEILLLDSRSPYAEIHRRLDGDRWLVDLVTTADGVLRLDSVPLELRLSELWRGLAVEEPSEEETAAESPGARPPA